MSNAMFINLNGATAAQICAHFDLNQEARSPLRDRMAPQSFVEALLANKQYITGIDFMAHALRTREAIWWGCLCLQHACGSDLSTIDKAACKAAVQWVLEPNEGHRTAVSAGSVTVFIGGQSAARMDSKMRSIPTSLTKRFNF
jgi:hypothetical protein